MHLCRFERFELMLIPGFIRRVSFDLFYAWNFCYHAVPLSQTWTHQTQTNTPSVCPCCRWSIRRMCRRICRPVCSPAFLKRSRLSWPRRWQSSRARWKTLSWSNSHYFQICSSIRLLISSSNLLFDLCVKSVTDKHRVSVSSWTAFNTQSLNTASLISLN